jgi:predicted RNA polymerase sigma factor
MRVVRAPSHGARTWPEFRCSEGESSAPRLGPYVLQAAIASLQADDPIDWPELAALYRELSRLTGSPVVELNRAVAIAVVDGTEAALAIVDELDLGEYQYLHSTTSTPLWRKGMRCAVGLLDGMCELDA